MASMENIKRVISHPDNNQMRDSKISKLQEDTPHATGDAPALEDEDMLNKLNISDAPVTSVSSRVESEADSSLSDENQNAPDGLVAASAATAAKIMQRTISADSNRSGSDSTGEAGRASIGNWGWFEDVHGHESVFLPGMKLDEGDELKGGKGEKKKGGLLQMGSELMSTGPLLSNIEAQRGKFTNLNYICSCFEHLFYWRYICRQMISVIDFATFLLIDLIFHQ